MTYPWEVEIMKIKTMGSERYAEVKITYSPYCQVCLTDFDDMEIVFYAVIDNNIVCRKCAKVHALVEPRLYLGD